MNTERMTLADLQQVMLYLPLNAKIRVKQTVKNQDGSGESVVYSYIEFDGPFINGIKINRELGTIDFGMD